jgi:hypothetical protein
MVAGSTAVALTADKRHSTRGGCARGAHVAREKKEKKKAPRRQQQKQRQQRDDDPGRRSVDGCVVFVHFINKLFD